MKLLLSLLILLSPISSFASDKGNGADSVATKSGVRTLLDLAENDELDYFRFNSQDYESRVGNAIEGIVGFSSQHTRKFDHLNPIFFKIMRDANQMDQLRWAWTDVPLEDIRDEGQISVMSPSKRQLAIQLNGLVLVNRQEFKLLDPAGKAALKLHELAIFAVLKIYPRLIPTEGTAPIRRFVRAFVETQTQNRPDYVLQDSVAALGPAASVYSFSVPVKLRAISNRHEIAIERSSSASTPTVVLLRLFDGSSYAEPIARFTLDGRPVGPCDYICEHPYDMPIFLDALKSNKRELFQAWQQRNELR